MQDDITNYIPKQFGLYQTLKVIHKSRCSIIFLAKHIKTHEVVACKLFPRTSLQHQHMLQRAEEEIRIAELVKCKGIVKIRTVVYQPDSIIIVMKYYPNGNLYDFISRGGPLSEACALNILLQIAKAISFLHKRNISHRDIKLENIVFSEDFKPNLIDFGLSTQTLYQDFEMRSTICGTFEYIAPEILSNRQYNPKKVDVWSLGICAYIMITGRYPWAQTQNVKELFQQIKGSDISVSGIPERIGKIIAMMVKRNPQERASIDEVIFELEKLKTTERSYQKPIKILKPHPKKAMTDIFMSKSSRKFQKRFNSY